MFNMRFSYLKERTKQLEEEKNMTMATLSKYKVCNGFHINNNHIFLILLLFSSSKSKYNSLSEIT